MKSRKQKFKIDVLNILSVWHAHALTQLMEKHEHAQVWPLFVPAPLYNNYYENYCFQKILDNKLTFRFRINFCLSLAFFASESSSQQCNSLRTLTIIDPSFLVKVRSAIYYSQNGINFEFQGTFWQLTDSLKQFKMGTIPATQLKLSIKCSSTCSWNTHTPIQL